MTGIWVPFRTNTLNPTRQLKLCRVMHSTSEVLLLSYPYSTYPGVSLRTLYLSLVVQANIVCLENGVTIPIFEYSTVVPTRHVPCVMIKTVVCDWILT